MSGLIAASNSQTVSSFQDWLQGRAHLIWLQPDALCHGFECSEQGTVNLPAGIEGALFIWDTAFFQQSRIGQNRQMFLWQALESISENLGENLLVIQAPMQTVLSTLLMQPLVLHTQRSPLNDPLFQMVRSMQQSPLYPAQLVWAKAENWIDYPKPLPVGFFKFWKVAEKQLFGHSE